MKIWFNRSVMGSLCAATVIGSFAVIAYAQDSEEEVGMEAAPAGDPADVGAGVANDAAPADAPPTGTQAPAASAAPELPAPQPIGQPRKAPGSTSPRPAGNNRQPRSPATAPPRSGLVAPNAAVVNLEDTGVASDNVPDGQELVSIDFPEQTEIKDIIRAVALWTGKNVILGRDVNGKVQMISPRRVTKEEAYQAFLSALELLGLTTVETGKVIKILPSRTAVKGNLKTILGSTWTPMTDEMITQIVPLKYIDAKEIQTTLSRLGSSNSMIAYRPTNTLIITDSGYKVRRILDIIQLLDVQGQQPKIAIVPIKYSDAKSIADKIQEIFQATKGGAAKAGSQSYHTYKIIVDERSNSVVIFGPPRTIQDVKSLVKRFDIRIDDPTRQSTIHVRPLDYADAKKLSSTLSALAQGSKGGSNLRTPPVAGNAKAPAAKVNEPAAVAQFSDDVKITADESSNSLLITGSRAAYEAINTIIRKLDIRKSQVFVETDILDVNVTGGFRFGTSIFAGQGSEKGTKIAYTWEAGKVAPVMAAQVGTASNETTLAALGAFKDEFTIGILAGKQVNIPGIGKISPGSLIKLVKNDSASRDLSSPSVLTANNETAKISVGNKLFYKSTEVGGVAGVPSERVQHEDVSLSLEIKPNISNTNYITLSLDLDASTGAIDPERQVPTVATRKMNQIVTVKNGQTVVISGLMKTYESESYSKIPLLGDIPILGWLFRNSTIDKQRTNLMIFITPHVVHGADDLAAIYEGKVKERDEFFAKVYGSNYEDDNFYKLLPKKEDGVFKADAFDVLDKQNRARLMKDLRQDMGYSNQEIKQIEAGEGVASEVDERRDEELTLPSVGGDGEGGGGDFSAPSGGGGDGDAPSMDDAPPPAEDFDPPEPIDPPEPME